MSIEIVPWDGVFLVVIRNGEDGRRVFQPSMRDALDYCSRYLAGKA